ncbi:M48 family metallopeptidase [bacterium]|nr:M48 family metallopeptidase [bacterium]
MVIAGIEIELTRKRVKNVNLRIHTPDGRVTVSAPRRTSEAFIAEFVAAKAPWIRKQQARIAAMPPRPELTYTQGEEHAFLGHPYPLEIYAAAGRPGAEFQADYPAESPEEPRLVVHARDPRDPAEIKRHIERAYRRELQARLDELVPAWSARLGVATQTVRIRAMKRKWGACRPQRRDIVFNLELAKQPTAAINYVVLHELAHLLEPSHGPRFQAILTEHMPDWREVETGLNGRVTTRG